jgi:hypothetical protein
MLAQPLFKHGAYTLKINIFSTEEADDISEVFQRIKEREKTTNAISIS